MLQIKLLSNWEKNLFAGCLGKQLQVGSRGNKNRLSVALKNDATYPEMTCILK